MRRTLLLLPFLPLLGGCVGDNLPQQPLRVVFFAEDSAQIDSAGQRIVADAAALAARNPAAPVRVAGFADPDGARAYNQALSQARARNVASALAAAGIAPGRITVSPRGEVAFAEFPTESRRVEIQVGP